MLDLFQHKGRGIEVLMRFQDDGGLTKMHACQALTQLSIFCAATALAAAKQTEDRVLAKTEY